MPASSNLPYKHTHYEQSFLKGHNHILNVLLLDEIESSKNCVLYLGAAAIGQLSLDATISNPSASSTTLSEWLIRTV